MSRQQQTTELLQVDLPFGPKPSPADVSDEILRRITDIKGAIQLSISASGLLDKQVASQLKLEKAQFSRMVGANYFPAEKLDELREVCGNNIVQRWWPLKSGMKLEPLLSTVEQELAAEKALRAEAERRLDTITKFLQQVGMRLT